MKRFVFATILTLGFFAMVLPASAGELTPLANGTVLDASADLLWQQGENPRMSWPAARTFCERLELGDRTGWRLPTRDELRDLIQPSERGSSIDTHLFPDVHPTVYWTADEDAAKVYGISFSSGDSFVFGSTNLPLYVRCVTDASGVLAPAPEEEISTAEIISEENVGPQLVPETQSTPSPQAAVLSWAEAWSQQDVDQYLSFYAPKFTPPVKMQQRDWAASRKKALSTPEWIQVKLSDLKVDQLARNRSTVSFVQHYQSNSYSDVVKKQLEMILEEGTWKILSEKVDTTLVKSP